MRWQEERRRVRWRQRRPAGLGRQGRSKLLGVVALPPLQALPPTGRVLGARRSRVCWALDPAAPSTGSPTLRAYKPWTRRQALVEGRLRALVVARNKRWTGVARLAALQAAGRFL